MSFSDMVTGSVLMRTLALIFLFVALLVSIGIAAYDLLLNRTIPQMVYAILYSGFGAALALLNINVGVGLQPMKNGSSINGGTQ